MPQYSADEVLQFAIRIEQTGGDFYRRLAERHRENRRLHDFFTYLAKEEEQHEDVFTDLVRFMNYEPAEQYNEEYFAYLRTQADNIIFAEEKMGDAGLIDDVSQALEFAMRREQDSIHYYAEMKNFVHPDGHARLDAIIAEERRHYQELYAMREQLKV